MQMSEDLYSNLKATFDEEKEKILANKTGDFERATAPDFARIPFAKWSQMPIKYSTGLVRSAIESLFIIIWMIIYFIE